MRIGELAEQTGLSRDTLRFYERRGLIKALRRPNGYRHYPAETLFLLGYIRTATRLGFTLAEIELELPALWGDGITAARIGEILTSKISVLDQRIADLAALRTELAAFLAAACPIVAA